MKRKESGQGLVEYTLILVLVAIQVISIDALFGEQIAEAFAKVVCSLVDGPCIQASPDEVSIDPGTMVIIDVLDNDLTRAESDIDLQIISGPSNGTALVLRSNNISYQPIPVFSGDDQFTYRVCLFSYCDSALVTVHVGSSSLAPSWGIATAVPVAERASGQSNRSQEDALESIEVLWEAAAEQEEGLDEAAEWLGEGLEESLEVLAGFAEETGDAELSAAVSDLQAALDDGDVAALIVAFPAITGALGAPDEVQAEVIMVLGRHLIGSCEQIAGNLVPVTLYQASLDAVAEVEEMYPGTTDDTVAGLQTVWVLIEKRNQASQDGVELFSFALGSGVDWLADRGYSEKAEQLAAASAGCSGG